MTNASAWLPTIHFIQRLYIGQICRSPLENASLFEDGANGDNECLGLDIGYLSYKILAYTTDLSKLVREC